MNKNREDKLIPVGTVAEMIGLSPDTIYKGKGGTQSLHRVKLGRSVRWSLIEVVDWIERKKAEATAPPQQPVKLRLISTPALNRKVISRIVNSKKK